MFSDYLQDIYPADSARDFANLGRRLFLLDGINPNIVTDGHSPDDRIMGCFPQQKLDTPVPVSGTGLTAGGTYYYGVKRRLGIGALEVPAACAIADSVQMDFNTMTCAANGATLATWQGLSDGKYLITIDGEEYNITGVDATGCASLEDVAVALETSLIEWTNNSMLEVAYDATNLCFVFKSNVSITVLSAASGTGTEISGSDYLNGTAGTIVNAANKRNTIVIHQNEYISANAASRVKNFYGIYRNKTINLSLLYLVDELSQEELTGTGSKGGWVVATEYETGDSVTLSGAMYRCIADHTAASDDQPGTGANWATYWRQIIVSAVTAWAADTAYSLSDMRCEGNILYTCILAHTSTTDDQPGTGINWKTYWIKKGFVTYTDLTEDIDLNTTYEVNTTENEANNFIPPCRYVRVYKGRLVCGGSIAFSPGTATITEGALGTVSITSDYPLRPTDIGAYIVIGADSSLSYQITAVDQVNKTYTISPEAAEACSDEVCSVFRDFDSLYVSSPLPSNIEGYITGEVVYPNFDNAELKGIAASGGNVYILRAGGIETVEGGDAGISLAPLSGSPPPCVSHKTIADDNCKAPMLIYYAGTAGIVVVSDGAHKVISQDIAPLILNEVDHDYDAFTHGVYDPVNNRYYLWLFGIGDVVNYGVRIPQLMLTYDFNRNFWTAGELAASASGLWRDTNGADIVVIGIAGGVAKLSIVPYDGVDMKGNVSSATTTTLTDSAAAFPVADEDNPGLSGLPVHVYDSAGILQRRIVKSNTATEITIYGTWEATPTDAYNYHVGPIRWNAETGDLAFETFDTRKNFERVVIAGETEEFDEWISDAGYLAGDKVQVNDDKIGDKAYRCISSHTSAAISQPETGANWATFWEVLNINVKVTVQSCGLERSRNAAKTEDLKKQGRIEISGSTLGLRGRGASVKLEGDGTDDVAILGIALTSTASGGNK
ncbi:MAG: hypothetical protein A2017_06600 [Lentisphaerae bacterium GWF2_44_16]|nr:MAG: hypothetical protein A2017_06600 [Lentisphaerae bacterium GWF2_44_16]